MHLKYLWYVKNVGNWRHVSFENKWETLSFLKMFLLKTIAPQLVTQTQLTLSPHFFPLLLISVTEQLWKKGALWKLWRIPKIRFSPWRNFHHLWCAGIMGNLFGITDSHLWGSHFSSEKHKRWHNMNQQIHRNGNKRGNKCLRTQN